MNLAQRLIRNKPTVVTFSILACALAGFFVIWFNLPLRPDVTPMPNDSGFYAYFGEAILHGDIPYRDVWDDKPPLGYYLNAAGLLIFGQNRWGIWWSSVFWIFGCTVLNFLVSKKLFGSITAGITSAIFLLGLMSPELFEGGNLMEVYGLAPQLAIIGITYLFFTHQRKPGYVVAIGVLTAISYLIKPSTVALGGASLLVMAASSLNEWKIRETLKIGIGFLAGFLCLVALVSLYWLLNGALYQFVDGLFLQGFYFIGGPESYFRSNFLNTLINVLPNLSIGKLFLIAVFVGGIFLVAKLYKFWIKPVWDQHLSLLDWLILSLIILFIPISRFIWPNRNIGKFILISIFAFGIFLLVKFYRAGIKPGPEKVFSPIEWTWLIAVISLPVEVLMASLGGRNYGHYFITLIPAVTMVAAYPIWRIVSVSRASFKSAAGILWNAVFLAFGVSILIWGVNSFTQDWPAIKYRNDLAGIFSGKIPLNELEEYIVQSTKPDDEVLIWHIHVGMNFITNRRAPSRFLFPLNLFIPPNAQNTKFKEFIDDLENNPPELIVVQRVSSLGLPFVDKPVDQLCDNFCSAEFDQAIKVPQIYQEWLRFQQFFEKNYFLDNKIYDWIVYRKIP